MNPNPLRRGFFAAATLLLALPSASLLLAQDAEQAPPPPPQATESATAATPATGTANAETSNRRQRDGQQGDRRANFNPEEMRARMLATIREQMGVTGDPEWQIISERVQKVNELRMASIQSMGGGFGGGRGPGAQGGAGGGFGRNRQANPEMESLQAAIKDNAPAAEIKTRLTRLRDTRKANEEKLTKAQEDLRAVLDVKQEAVAVVFGLLP